jgi:Ca-activated chloride channel homolog
MLSFAYPWAALAAPLPCLVCFLAPAHSERRAALLVPFFNRLVSLTGRAPREGLAIGRRGLWRTLLLGLCWLLAIAALMRPEWIEPPLHRDKPARDLMLLVDLSQSMETRDFKDASGATVDRVTAVKQVLDDFLSKRKGDRVGIIVFGDAPYVLVPFTADLDLARRLLQEMRPGMAGPRTAFGDAIGLAIDAFSKSTAKAKTIIALTDGNDTGSRAPPKEAAAVAHDRGILINTVAIGDPSTIGDEKLDEDTPRTVAESTGRGYYRAMDRKGLDDIYRRLDALETRKIDTVTFRPKTEIYWIPLAAALILSMGVEALALVFGWLRERAERRPAAREPLRAASCWTRCTLSTSCDPGRSSPSPPPCFFGLSFAGRTTRPRAGATSSTRRFSRR